MLLNTGSILPLTLLLIFVCLTSSTDGRIVQWQDLYNTDPEFAYAANSYQDFRPKRLAFPIEVQNTRCAPGFKLNPNGQCTYTQEEDDYAEGGSKG
ncbi:hypothetical protein Ocin01_05495 [Orchesella cincta]|uniref:Uncharacterized protein n=1 Tax=Orchesella cincta TaxID=48709 RepID=A0A1D2N7G1_ORCCI|nr:hypothetical protein Ocin01_05495 [Orchesella cincta]